MSDEKALTLAPEIQPTKRKVGGSVLPSTPVELLAFALQQGKDIATINQLMDLQDRWERREARKAFDAAVSDAKGKIKPIQKRREVDFANRNAEGRTQYKFEDLALIAEEVDPILSEVGLSYRYRPAQSGKTLTVTCILAHRDGYFEEVSLSCDYDTSGNKNPAQSVASTATYLQRYTLKLALGLSATNDDDGNGGPQVQTARPDSSKANSRPPKERSSTSMGGVISASQLDVLKKSIDSAGVMEADILKRYDIPRLEDLLFANLNDALTYCKRVKDGVA